MHSFVNTVFPLRPNLSVKTDTNTYLDVTIFYIPSLYYIMETLIIYLPSLSFPRFEVVLGKDKIVVSLLTKYLNLLYLTEMATPLIKIF